MYLLTQEFHVGVLDVINESYNKIQSMKTFVQFKIFNFHL